MKILAALLFLKTVHADGVRGPPANRKLQLQLVGYGGEPAANRFPLRQCEGDCDNDGECAAGLYCYQRQAYQDVPGCIGGTDFPAGSDFCVAMESSFGTNAPTWAPTWAPTIGDQVGTMPPTEAATEGATWDLSLPELEYIGDGSGMPIGLCQGDCDVDEDCIDELVCFQRDYNEPVPGCRPGQDYTSVDYCVLPPAPEVVVTMAPTSSVTLAATEFVVALMNVGDNVGLPLGLCQGDCDTNEDCLDDLICFQRDGYEPVPGCIGAGSASYDYCIMDPFATASPTTMAYNDTYAAPAPAPADNTTETYTTPLQNIGDNLDLPLGLCQGDCDTNEDCLDDLICFQRDSNEQVPGCSGTGSASYDYCIMDPNANATYSPMITYNATMYPAPAILYNYTTAPAQAPVEPGTTFIVDGVVVASAMEAPTSTVFPSTAAPSTSPTAPLPVLSTVGKDVVGAFKLGVCQGHCNIDDDCRPGLICLARNKDDAVPGCAGKPNRGDDYCVYPF